MDPKWACERRMRAWLFVLLCGLVAPGPASAQAGRIVEDRVHGAALEGNLLGDSLVRPVTVYLPPGYDRDAGARYPVVYLLHGFTGSHTSWGPEGAVGRTMDALLAAGRLREMILVMPDASNRYFGSFYTNSVVTGNWEDFVTRDLVDHVDRTYRTLPQAASRGVAGHSMGGYGALKLAMKRPDVFGAVYALSPCCLGWGPDLSLDNPAWDRVLSMTSPDELARTLDGLMSGTLQIPWQEGYYSVVFVALAAAWSPNPDRAPFFADLPVARFGSTLGLIDNVQARWSANMPLAMVDQYRSNLARLRGIAFDVGRQDEFAHIPLTTRALSRALAQNAVAHRFEEYDGFHMNGLAQRLEAKLLPFFSETLSFEAETAAR